MSCFVQTERYATIMAVMARESWTDERLDDLKEGMDQRFDRVEATIKEGFARVEGEMKEGFAQVDEMKEGFVQAKATSDERFTRLDREFEQVVASIRELRGDIKGMQRLMVQGFFGICTLMVTCFGILAGMIGL